jgi:hypothetical protein
MRSLDASSTCSNLAVNIVSWASVNRQSPSLKEKLHKSNKENVKNKFNVTTRVLVIFSDKSSVSIYYGFYTVRRSLWIRLNIKYMKGLKFHPESINTIPENQSDDSRG